MTDSYVQNTAENVLRARLDNVRKMGVVLRALSGYQDRTIDRVHIDISKEGIRFSTDSSQCYSGTAILEPALFEDYILFGHQLALSAMMRPGGAAHGVEGLDGRRWTFRLPLTTLIDALNIFGGASSVAASSTTGAGTVMFNAYGESDRRSAIAPGNPILSKTAVRLHYEGQGHPFILMMEESGITTNCSIKTMDENESALDLQFATSDIIGTVIMKAEWFREAFADLDMSSEVLEIRMSLTQPHLQLITQGDAGRMTVAFPHNADVMDDLQLKESHITFRYRLSLIKNITKALPMARRINLRMNEQGTLNVRVLMKHEDDQDGMIEYTCAADVGEDELGEYDDMV
eukprot:Clim_evm6s247 gene=Clim_evmTU6s247